jgi:hypothetical protein
MKSSLTIPHEAAHVHQLGYAPYCPDCSTPELAVEVREVGFNRPQSYSSFMGWKQWDYVEYGWDDIAIAERYDEDDFLWLVCTPGCKNCKRVSELEGANAGQDIRVTDLRRAGRGEREMRAA